jgi:hypothetical protein
MRRIVFESGSRDRIRQAKALSSDGSLSRTTLFVSLLILVASPFLLSYDFSKSNLWYYDFLSMNAYTIWFLIAVTIAVVALSWKNRGPPLLIVIVVALLFSVAEIAVNYPMIWRDVYLHGSACLEILEKGRIVETYDPYPQSNPGYFLLWSITSLVTGLQLFPSNLLLLLPVAVILLVVVCIAIFRRLSLRKEYANAAGLFAFLVMNFNTNEFMFVHFNTRLLSILLVLAFVLLLLAARRSPAQSAALLLTYTSLVIAHPLNSLLVIVFLGAFLFIRFDRSTRSISLLFFCIVIYMLWSVYLSITTVAELGKLLLDFLGGIKSSAEVAYGWLPTAPRAEPAFGILLGTYYKLLLIVLASLSLFSAVLLRRQRHARFLFVYLLSVSVLFGAAFLMGLGDIALDRGILFASVAFAGLPIMICASRWEHQVGPGLKRRLLLFTLITVLIVPQFVFAHQLPMVRYERVGSIDSTMVFVSTHRAHRSIAAIGDFPYYYCYYEPTFKDYRILWYSDWNSLNDVNYLFANNTQSLKIIDYKNIIDWGAILRHADSYEQAFIQWHTLVTANVDGDYGRIYSNGYETTYA